jgi:anhydro-N-acetylmuramic acid kinase
MASRTSRLFVGLMSGTSIDGVDAALVDIPRDGPVTTLARSSLPMPGALRERLAALALGKAAGDGLDAACGAAIDVSRLYADAVARLLEGRRAQDVVAIGAHGQTVRHAPGSGYSLQLVDGALLAELTGRPVACDFRSGDIAAGGEGAPLVPAYHRAVFGHPAERRAVVNIGGIANISWLAGDEPVLGFDTGPGNTLMDGWCARHTGRDFDADGAWAASAAADAALLSALLAEPYFARPAPKSTGRETFHLDWLAQWGRSARIESLPPAVVQATLLELTARTIADALAPLRPDAVLVCGGGVRNRALMERLRALVAPARCESTESVGIDPQAVEASAFAWLAARRIDRLPGNLPSATGARGPRVLGALYDPRPAA